MMKNTFFLLLLLAFFAACESGKTEKKGVSSMELVTDSDSIYYALGAQFSTSLATSKLPLNSLQFRNGYLDCKQGQSYINQSNVANVTGYFRKRIRALQEGDVLKASIDSFSYAYGGNQYFQLKSYGLKNMNQKAMFAGMEDYLGGKEGSLNSNQVRLLMGKFRVMAEKAQVQLNTEIALANKKRGQDFIIQKRADKDVKSTRSGVHYKVIRPGTGARPKATDKVKVHYEGRSINGKVFDSSYERGEPIEFPLDRMIKGWTEGLLLMREGAKYELYIPGSLAYGDQGKPPAIGPGETLVFIVELLEVIRE